MKVRELISLLETIENKERIVIMSRDEEGNGFSPLVDIDSSSNYDASERTIGLEKLTEGLREKGYSDEDVVEGEPAVVLWPAH